MRGAEVVMPATTDLPSTDAPEFAPIRADLARLYIARKADLGLLDWTDAQLVERVDDVTSALMACSMDAVERGDEAWLERHRWFGEACERLLDGLRATGLDG